MWKTMCGYQLTEIINFLEILILGLGFKGVLNFIAEGEYRSLLILVSILSIYFFLSNNEKRLQDLEIRYLAMNKDIQELKEEL